MLGAILAGGASRRFGSDKALARLAGVAMIDRVIDVLRPQVAAIVVCGRPWRGVWLADRPGGRVGPLAGLNAALHHARARGFAAVLCAPVDVHPLPSDLLSLLQGEAAQVLDEQHVVGFWPVGRASDLDAYLREGGRSVAGWVERSGATRLARLNGRLINVNRPDDLRASDLDAPPRSRRQSREGALRPPAMTGSTAPVGR